ncbi:hypothetical protein [Pseudoalteromonas xiamenensis]
MQKFVAILAFVFSLISLGVSLNFALSQKTAHPTDITSVEPTTTNVAPLASEAAAEKSVQHTTINLDSADTQALKNYVQNLEHRIKELEQLLVFQQPASEEFKNKVFAIIEEKQKLEMDKMQKENPIYSFYSELPEDYEFKIKTDPEYAEQVGKELKQKVLNESLTPAERLAAIGQLQMNMYALNRNELEHLDYEVVDSMIKMTNRLDDEKLRVQALEMLSHTPVIDVRIARQFKSMLDKESNDYVRSIAVDGLMSQFYQARQNNADYRKQLALDILNVYENTTDKSLQNLFNLHLGDEERLNDLKKVAGL